MHVVESHTSHQNRIHIHKHSPMVPQQQQAEVVAYEREGFGLLPVLCSVRYDEGIVLPTQQNVSSER